MRGATQCARRLKQLVRSLRTKLGKVGRPSGGDAITQMILGIFSRDVPESKARAALDRLRAMVVDYNELRVVPPIEMTEMVGSLPDARLKCEDLSRALNRVFAFEHEVSLECLRELSRKEVCEYVDGIDGLDAYSRARVRLRGLHQHAVPLDEAMWAYARKEKIIDRHCSLEEAQAFLERRIPDGEALEFVGLIEKQAWGEMGAAVRSGEVERIVSIPPDRTARNMLQMVASGRSVAAGLAGSEEAEEPAAKPTGSKRPKKAKKRKPATKTRKKAGAAKAARKPKRKTAVKRRAQKTKTKASARKKKTKKPTRAKRKPATRGKRKAGKTRAKPAAKRVGRSARRAKSA